MRLRTRRRDPAVQQPVQDRLVLATTLSLPLEVITQSIAVVAKRRVGKSYLARRLAEQVFKAGQQLVIMDPKGDWWGIRSSADGSAPGLPILIIGGIRGDIPLAPDSGEAIAKLIVEERVSALIDLSDLRKHEVATWAAVFLETLYRLKNQEQFRTAMLLLIDEADAIAPQKPQPNEARMLGAASDIVRRGGQRGIGCMLITQRTAVLSKDLLTQSQVLIALRTIAPQDLDAMNDWINVHGTREQRSILMESLPSLPIGDAWVWSPGWPTDEGIFERMHTLPITTFDSGATPKPGERRIAPKTVAEIDLEAVKRQMADVIERQRADDPKELRAQIARLQKDYRIAIEALERQEQAEAERVTAPSQPEPARQPIIGPEQVEMLERAIAALRELPAELGRAAALTQDTIEQVFKAATGSVMAVRVSVDGALNAANGLSAALRAAIARDLSTPAPQPKAAQAPAVARPLRPIPVDAGHPDPDDGEEREYMPGGQQGALVAIAQHAPNGVTPDHLSMLLGVKRSYRDLLVQKLARAGHVERRDGRIHVTASGRKALPRDFKPLPTGDALRARMLKTLPGGEREMLRLICEVYPAAIDRESLAELMKIKRSYRDLLLQKLTRRVLIEKSGKGAVRARGELFSSYEKAAVAE